MLKIAMERIELSHSACLFILLSTTRVFSLLFIVNGPQVHEHLSRFRKYDWLWKEDKDVKYRQFVESNPVISDYEVS